MEKELLRLGEVFFLEIASYAMMSNHYHVVLFIDQESMKAADSKEIVSRWHRIHKGLSALVLKNTNILMNDLHYRKVKSPWELWVREIASSSKNSVIVFSKKQEQVERYRKFVALLILRAHKKLGWQIDSVSDSSASCNGWLLTRASGVKGSLLLKDGEWRLISNDQSVDVVISALLMQCIQIKPLRHVACVLSLVSLASAFIVPLQICIAKKE